MQAPASEYRAPPTPVPDRAVLAVLHSTLPFAELAGGQDLRTGPLGTIGLLLPIISRYVDSTFKSLPPCTTPLGLNKFYHTQTGQTTKPAINMAPGPARHPYGVVTERRANLFSRVAGNHSASTVSLLAKL